MDMNVSVAFGYYCDAWDRINSSIINLGTDSNIRKRESLTALFIIPPEMWDFLSLELGLLNYLKSNVLFRAYVMWYMLFGPKYIHGDWVEVCISTSAPF